MHLADAFIQSDFQAIQILDESWTHNLCAANAML